MEKQQQEQQQDWQGESILKILTTMLVVFLSLYDLFTDYALGGIDFYLDVSIVYLGLFYLWFTYKQDKVNCDFASTILTIALLISVVNIILN